VLRLAQPDWVTGAPGVLAGRHSWRSLFGHHSVRNPTFLHSTYSKYCVNCRRHRLVGIVNSVHSALAACSPNGWKRTTGARSTNA
jgi:hypothetical protein